MKTYLLVLWLVIFCFGSFKVFSQQTPRMTTGGYGYLEKLPADYLTNPTKKYPVLFFLHGLGERGNGSPTDLNKIKAHGPPYHIENGSTMCFTNPSTGVNECFIVISPQLPSSFGGWWSSVLYDVFNYVLTGPQNYRIDLNKVYVTGLSLGGQGVYNSFDPGIPDIFAAAAPVSAFGNGYSCSISARKVPMWGFHGTVDGTITYATGFANFDNINYCTTPVPVAEYKWTSYAGLGHNIWNNYAYRVDNNLHTPNLYQWLLTKSKSTAPTANAGPDIFLILPVNSTVLVGTGSDPGGSIVSYVWTKQSGGSATLTNDLTSTLGLTNLTAGVYVFRLTVTDNDGNTGFDEVTITVSSSPTLFITNPSPVCSPASVNLTNAAITIGSTPGLTFTYWTDAAATVPYPTPSTATTGTYYIKGTTSAGGSDTKPVNVVVNSAPTLVVNNPAPVCAPASVDVTPASITTGSTGGVTLTYWTNSLATTPLATPTSVNNGTYYIKATNGSGCFDIKPVNVVVQAQPNLIITNPPAICSPGLIDLTATSITAGSTIGLIYTYWTNSTATVSLANASSVSTSGTYFVKGTDVSGCSSIRPVIATINTAALVVATNPSAVCSPTTVDITAGSVTAGSTAGLTFTYWTNAGATSPLASPSALSTSGTYYIKGANAGCSDIKPVTVTTNTSPNLLITNPSAVCAPSTIDLTLASVTAGSSGGLTLSYWSDAAASVTLATPSAITSSGTYYIRATNAGVCPSIKPVVVTINPVALVTVTNPAPACSPATIDLTTAAVTAGSTAGLTFTYWTDAGATSPLASPATLSISGTYYIKGANAGCSDIKSVTVTVNTSPNLLITNPPAVCAPSTIDLTLASVIAGSSGGLTLTYWSDPAASVTLATPSAIISSGTYYIRATNAGVCPSIKPVVVTINPIALVTVTNPAPACSPATIDLTTADVTAGSTAGLTFTYWTDAGATGPLANPTSLSTSGTYYIKGANAGCSDIKPVTVTFNTSPNVTITNPGVVCDLATIDLTVASITAGSSAGLTFSYWTNSGGTTSLSNPNSVAAGTYFIKGTNTTTGCSDIRSVVVVVNPMPLVVATPNNSTICTGSPSNISLNTSNSIPGGVNYAWTASLLSGNASGFSNSNGSTISQNLTTTTGGTVRYIITPTSVTGGCAGPSTSADVTVSLIPDIAINTGASTSVVCSGCSTTIVLQNPNNVAGTTFSWTASVLNGTVTGQSSGSGAIISQVLIKSTTTGAVRYTIIPKAGSCNGIPTTFDVRINAVPTVNAGPDQSISLPTNSVVLSGSGVDDGTIVSYTWTKLTGPATFTLQNAATPTLTVSDLIVGSYVFRLEVKDDDSATGFDEVTVIVSPKPNLPPVVSAGPDIDLQLPTNQVMITGTASDPDGTIKSTTWSQVSGTSATLNVVANTLELINLVEGTYVFRFSATDDGDITSSDDVNVVVAPNDFTFTATRNKFITPNGDGQNDFWVLDTNIAKFASCKLIILQNDGSKVLETIGYQNNWDGTANGKVLPQDVYYYVLECNGVKDSGSITIVR